MPPSFMELTQPSSTKETPSMYSEILATYYLNEDIHVSSLTPLARRLPTKKLIAMLRNREPRPFCRLGEFRGTLFKVPTFESFLCLIKFELGNAGILFRSSEAGLRLAFRTYFARMLLSHLQPNVITNSLSVPPEALLRFKHLVFPIVDLFEKKLLYQGTDITGWLMKGKHLFTGKVCFFVGCGLPIQFCLPAFPCKTTNPEKAATNVPDGAEYEALTTLHVFCRDLEEIYQPGAEITIVSDGHVFSDCMGADDDTVSEYNAHVRHMSEVVARETHGKHSNSKVLFLTLRRLLWPNLATSFFMDMIMEEDPARCEMDINNPVRTRITYMDDIARRLLVNTCAPDAQQIHDLIRKVPEHALTALYRGFSRFMFDDLAFHQDFQSRSISQRKKAAETVALEMMRRNQAYSRLVELIFPKHIRLSIHAHDNSGPKFGIRLLPNAQATMDVSTISTDNHMVECEQRLHIPTPWHNALVEIPAPEGEGVVIACCRAATIRAAGYHYVSDHPRGGRFVHSASEE